MRGEHETTDHSPLLEHDHCPQSQAVVRASGVDVYMCTCGDSLQSRKEALHPRREHTEMITFFAPAPKCNYTLSFCVKLPTDSQM